MHSVPRFNYFADHGIDPQLLLHPSYTIGRPSGCEICVLGWAKFTPYTAPADVRRLLQLDLSCLTRWRPCVTQSDMMPAAWAQFLAERPRVNESRDQPACSLSLIEILGRDSANIVAGEILEYHASVSNQSYGDGVARVRILERLKGAASWNVDETRDMPIVLGTSSEGASLHAGAKLIFFGGLGHEKEMRIGPGYGCPAVSMDDTNLRLVRRGIDEDYSAADNTE